MKTKSLKSALLMLVVITLFSCNGKKSKENTDSSIAEKGVPAVEKSVSDGPITAAKDGKVQHINTTQFINYVNDFKSSSTFKMKSELPCVIDFYADWCKPCKMISPYLDELAVEYKGKINFLKIDVDVEAEIANFYQIQAIPAMMFCPLKGNYSMEVGASDKASIKKNVEKYIHK